MTSLADRLNSLYALERKGVLQNVSITAPGDGARRFTFTTAGDKREKTLKSHELDPFLQGVALGLAARTEEPESKPAK